MWGLLLTITPTLAQPAPAVAQEATDSLRLQLGRLAALVDSLSLEVARLRDAGEDAGADDATMFSNRGDSSTRLSNALRFADDSIYLRNVGSGGTNEGNADTNALYRDPAAWYHIVWQWNTLSTDAEERQKLFVNGERVTSWALVPDDSAQNFSTHWMQDGERLNIGNIDTNGSLTSFYDGLMTDIYCIDGYALGPENFGEYKNGAWIPKAYAGAPPMITDSSSYSAYGSTADGGNLDYDRAYIGESSMTGSGSSSAHDLKIFGSGDHSQYWFPVGTDWTYDFWIYPTNDAEGYLQFGLGDSATSTGTADHPIDGTGTTWYMMNFMMSGSSGSNWQLGGGGSWQYFPHTGATTEWHHISYIRHKGGDECQIFHNGVLAKTVTTGDDAQINLPHFYMLPTSGQGFTSIGKASGTNGAQIWVDEIRLIKGEAHPPRFYFGTNHGDQDGGRLPHRATSADRFVDDERTVLLVSGQSANNHARSVSLVDESGLHPYFNYLNYDFACSTISPSQRLKSIASKNNIKVFDPTKRMKNAFERRILENNFTPFFFTADDNHINSFASRYLAESVALDW